MRFSGAFFLPFWFILFWSGCSHLPFSLNTDQIELSFDGDTFNYHETRTLLQKKNPARLLSEESLLSVQIQIPCGLPTQQSAFSRLGCQEVQFSLDSDFISDRERVPCEIACILDIQKNFASVQGSGIAIGRIGIFLIEQSEGTLVAQKIIDEVTALDDQQETSLGHQQKKEFVLPVSLNTQTPYKFYVELLGKAESFSETAICEVSMNCVVLEFRVRLADGLSLLRST